MKVDQLNDAFQQFSAASKSLETYYGELKDRIAYLTNELEIRNTQLHAALAEAERNKDYLKAILHNLEEAIIALDPEGRITTLNRSAEVLLGVDAAAGTGKLFADLDFAITREGTDTVLNVRGKTYSIILSHSDVFAADGGLQGRVILIKDVSRLRELELRHERNQRLIAMGEMAAKLVHEIRNPLCSIELFASMLEGDLVAREQKNMARGITSGISSLNTILTNMLFFARPNKPALSRVSLDAVVAESLRQLQPMMESRRVSLEKTIERCTVHGDAELLKQVLMNIMINGIQAMPNGGAMKVALQAGERSCVVSVQDTGCGIARENRERIFDPFFTTKDSGTGLGLVIASNIMQANNGYIQVTSEPGKGSTFSLHFPVETGSGSQASDPLAVAAALPGAGSATRLQRSAA